MKPKLLEDLYAEAKQSTKVGRMNAPMGVVAEKFAELIVKECVGVVEGGSFLHDQAPTAIFARECSGAIKRHFGVEEWPNPNLIS